MPTNVKARYLLPFTLLLTCLWIAPAYGDALCFSPVKKRSGDIASDRPWSVPFNYRVQVDNGPVIKPSGDSSTGYEFNSDSPWVKIWLGDEIVESFRVPADWLAEGRKCIYFQNLYETWSIVHRWQADRLCSCTNVDSNEQE